MKIKILLYLILLKCNILFCQELFFKNIGTNQGLPSSETYRSFQDRNGYIWISTDAGVCRYDGKNMVTYTTKDGLPENVVFDIYEDVHGRLWFNCMSGYLVYYENEKFHAIAANSKLKKMCLEWGILHFYIGEKDTLYCNAAHVYQLIKIAPKDNYKEIFYQPNPPGCSYSLVLNKLNKREMVLVYNRKADEGKEHVKLYSELHHKVFTVENSKVWGQIRMNVDAQKNIHFAHLNILYIIRPDGTNETYNLGAYILFVKSDKNNNLWIGTRNGVSVYKNSDINSKPIRVLQGIQISSVMLDKENNIWLTSLQNGVFISVNKDISCIFSKNDYLCNFSVSDSNLYIGYASKKELKINPDYSISDVSANTSFLPSSLSLRYIFEYNSCSFYGSENGLYGVNQGRKERVRDYKSKSGSRNIGVRKIISIGKDSFAVVNTLEVHFFHKLKCYNRVRPPFNVVKSIIRLKDKTILIGSRNNEGIFKVQDDTCLPYFEQYPQLKTRINDLAEDKYGNIWIATNEKGLFCASKNKLYQYTPDNNNLNSYKVGVLSFDNHGNLWAGTNKGLNKIVITGKLENTKILSFNETHGLPAMEIEHLASFRNKMFCGSKESVFYFNSDSLNLNTVPPLVYLTSIAVNSSALDKAATPDLEYNDNNLEFKFTSITYKDIGRQNFLYKLNGYDKQWKFSQTGQRQYTNLPAGTYRFDVYALNNDKVKSIQPASFSFTIQKPFWLRWWFITAEIIFGSFLIYLIVISRINKIRKEEEEKTRVNKKMIEFQITALRAQMNPHFIFNAISSIQHYILKKDTYQSYNYLAKFAKLIRNILDTSQQEYVSVAEEIYSVNLYVELEKVRFKEPFESKINIAADIDIETTLLPTMLIQPYVENAIWHGLLPKQTSCELIINFDILGDNLQITIIDNGIGIEASKRIRNQGHKSKGISLTEMRIQSLTSKYGKPFKVSIVDLSGENNGTGTKVTITMPLIID